MNSSYTAIELLVTISLIIALCSINMVAIQKARNSAVRSMCKQSQKAVETYVYTGATEKEFHQMVISSCFNCHPSNP